MPLLASTAIGLTILTQSATFEGPSPPATNMGLCAPQTRSRNVPTQSIAARRAYTPQELDCSNP